MDLQTIKFVNTRWLWPASSQRYRVHRAPHPRCRWPWSTKGIVCKRVRHIHCSHPCAHGAIHWVVGQCVGELVFHLRTDRWFVHPNAPRLEPQRLFESILSAPFNFEVRSIHILAPSRSSWPWPWQHGSWQHEVRCRRGSRLGQFWQCSGLCLHPWPIGQVQCDTNCGEWESH